MCINIYIYIYIYILEVILVEKLKCIDKERLKASIKTMTFRLIDNVSNGDVQDSNFILST